MARDFRRTSQGRAQRIRILVAVEGEATEPNYFYALQREHAARNGLAVFVHSAPRRSPETVVRKAVDLRAQASQPYAEVWCVLDVEAVERRRSLDAAAELAEANDIRLALSNPAFEVWLLAHFIRTSRRFADCDAVIQELDKHWPEVAKAKYSKDDEKIYQRLTGRTETAIANAKAVRENDHSGIASTADANSSTDIYRLVSRLLGRQ